MSEKKVKDYDWASAIVALVSANTENLAALAKEAGLDPLSGDLSDIDLSNLNLSGQNFSGWDLRNAKFTNSRLSDTELRNARVNPDELIEAIDWQEANLDEDLRSAAEKAAIERHQILNVKISDLEFSVRTSNGLKTAEIMFMGELVQKTEAEILRLPNMGRKPLNEIKEVLAQYRLHLGMDVGNWLPSKLRRRARTARSAN